MSIADNAKTATDLGDHAQGWLLRDLPTGVIIIFLLLFLLMLVWNIWGASSRVRELKSARKDAEALSAASNLTLAQVSAASADMAKTMALALQKLEARIEVLQAKIDQAISQGIRRKPPGETHP